MLALALAVLLPALASAGCQSAMDCSLNGVCSGNICVCDKPWSGPSCGILAFRLTPATGKSLYNASDPRNTWNGPIVAGPDGKYHIYDPIYRVGSLSNPTSIMHGMAENITGPWEWVSQKDVCTDCGENPAFVVFEDEGGKTV